jgi:nucleotide-binding universal stress UspA family protein
VILRYADEADADLVVMGTHGRTGVERYLLGSVAEKVVRLSDVPVMTVRADEDE